MGWLTRVTKNNGPQNKIYAAVMTRNILTRCTPSRSIRRKYSRILRCSSSAPDAWNNYLLLLKFYLANGKKPSLIASLYARLPCLRLRLWYLSRAQRHGSSSAGNVSCVNYCDSFIKFSNNPAERVNFRDYELDASDWWRVFWNGIKCFLHPFSTGDGNFVN